MGGRFPGFILDALLKRKIEAGGANKTWEQLINVTPYRVPEVVSYDEKYYALAPFVAITGYIDDVDTNNKQESFSAHIRVFVGLRSPYIDEKIVVFKPLAVEEARFSDSTDSMKSAALNVENKIEKIIDNHITMLIGEEDKVLSGFNEAIRLDPKNAQAYNNRGAYWHGKMKYDKALADYDEAVRLDPKNAQAYNEDAWIWATCPDQKFRDGNKAVELASRACELGNWKDAGHIDTLAAAYAEAGNFAKAVEFQEQANRLSTDPEDHKKGEDRLKLYKEKKPYRETE